MLALQVVGVEDGGKPASVQQGNVPEVQATPGGELWDLENLARARRLCDWMFEQFAWAARGACAEIGPGIGTFSARLLDAGVESLLLIEPENACADVVEK